MYNKKKIRLAFILPCYNEEKTVQMVINNIPKGYDIIIINDGSSDKTKKIIKKNQRKIFLINNRTNLGYDRTLFRGFEFALKKKYNFVVTLDTDNQFYKKDIISIINENKKFELVLGNRSIKPRIGEILASKIFQNKTGIKDPYCGLKRYKLINKFKNIPKKNYSGLQFLIPFLNSKKIKNKKIKIKKRKDNSRFGNNAKINFLLYYNAMVILNDKKY